MRKAGIVALLAAGVTLTGGAGTAAALVLKSGGVVAPLGTPVTGILSHEPCDRFEMSGELISNSQPADEARFGSGVKEFGRCEREGVKAGASLYHFKLTERRNSKASLAVQVSVNYITFLAPGAVGEECPYHIGSFNGKFAIPGPTMAIVSATGKRYFPSPSTCPEKLHLKGWEAKLYDAETGELFEAEP
jgi:hypothetical protein